MKTYMVQMLSGKEIIDLESLPVAKITFYPWEKRDYKPYAQVAFGIDETEGFHFRMASFEVAPAEDSEIEIIVYPFSDLVETYLRITATPQEVQTQICYADKKMNVLCEYHGRNGADLQGEYWGYDVKIPIKELTSVGSVVTLEEEIIHGNFYKLQKTGRTHYGSFGEQDFSPDELFRKEAMVPFSLVSY